MTFDTNDGPKIGLKIAWVIKIQAVTTCCEII